MEALLIVLCVALGIALVVAWAEIFARVGWNRWWCLIMIVPVLNAVVFLWFAFSRWPLQEFILPGWRIKNIEKKKAQLDSELSDLVQAEDPSYYARAQEAEAVKQRKRIERETKVTTGDDSPATKGNWIVFGVILAGIVALAVIAVLVTMGVKI